MGHVTGKWWTLSVVYLMRYALLSFKYEGQHIFTHIYTVLYIILEGGVAVKSVPL